jgi:glycosyltransferase involved in cell wall biosynthesis
MTQKAPISVCMVVRNEEKTLPRCLSSFEHYVSELIIVDTGSTDKTMEDFATHVFHGCNDEQGRIIDFSSARNQSFSLATQPYVMWLDADDEVVNADYLPRFIELVEDIRQKATCNGGQRIPIEIHIPYEHHDANGNVVLTYSRERIVSKNDFRWVAPVHEVLIPNGHSLKLDTSLLGMEKKIAVVHRKAEWGKFSEPRRNLRILEYQLKKNGNLEPRMMFYLAREYHEHGEIEKAISVYERYVTSSFSEDEKAFALMKLVELYLGKDQSEMAISTALRLIGLKESLPESYFYAAKAYYIRADRTKNHRDWQRVVNFCEIGFACPKNEKPLFFRPQEREDIFHYFERALGMTGQVDRALALCEEKLKIYPTDRQYLHNRDYYLSLKKVGN